MTTPGSSVLKITVAVLLSFSFNLVAENMQIVQHHPDHFVVGISDLDLGMRLIEEKTGVRPAHGGTHPHIGTHNALISLGKHTYLEIIAPDPDADPDILDAELKDRFMEPLKQMTSLTPYLWAIGSTDLGVTARLLEREGIQLSTPEAGSRKRPDGSLLDWQASFVSEPQLQGLPFFIQWMDPDNSPPNDSPKGCLLKSYSISGPDSQLLEGMTKRLSLDVEVSTASEPGIQITLDCPGGQVKL